MTTETKARADLIKGWSRACDFLCAHSPQMRISQIRLLMEVAKEEGRTMSEYAKLMDMTAASVSRNCDHRLGAVWFKAKDCPINHAVKRVYLSKQGALFVERLVDYMEMANA